MSKKESILKTAILVLSVINGIVRYSRINLDPEKNLLEAAVAFCKRSLLFTSFATKRSCSTGILQNFMESRQPS